MSTKRTLREMLADDVTGSKLNAEAAIRRGDHVKALRFLSTALAFSRARQQYFETRGQPEEGARQVAFYRDQVELCMNLLQGVDRIGVENSRYVDQYAQTVG
jgi:hypothetical protein